MMLLIEVFPAPDFPINKTFFFAMAFFYEKTMTAKDPKMVKPAEEHPNEEMQIEKSAEAIIKGTETDFNSGLF